MNAYAAIALPRFMNSGDPFQDFSANWKRENSSTGLPAAHQDTSMPNEGNDKEGSSERFLSLEEPWSKEYDEIHLEPELSDWFSSPLQAVFLGLAKNPDWLCVSDYGIYLEGLEYVPNGTDMNRLLKISNVIADPGKGIETLSDDDMGFLRQLGFRHPALDNEMPRISWGTYVSPDSMGISGASVSAQMVPKPPLDIEAMQNGPKFGSGRTRKCEMDSHPESGFYPQTPVFVFSGGLPQPPPPV